MVPTTWIAHRRDDGEHVGWLVPSGERFEVMDLLGRPRTSEPVDWWDGEQVLEALGIGYLAEPWVLVVDEVERPVRIGEATPDRIVVVADDFGSASVVGASPQRFVLAFPAPASLRPR